MIFFLLLPFSFSNILKNPLCRIMCFLLPISTLACERKQICHISKSFYGNFPALKKYRKGTGKHQHLWSMVTHAFKSILFPYFAAIYKHSILFQGLKQHFAIPYSSQTRYKPCMESARPLTRSISARESSASACCSASLSPFFRIYGK